MRLQATMAGKVESLGNIPFNEFRGFRSMVREAKEPYRFVDGELIERFLTCEPSVQDEIVKSVGATDVDEVKVTYPSMWELMDDLRDMGESNAVLGRSVTLGYMLGSVLSV